VITTGFQEPAGRTAAREIATIRKINPPAARASKRWFLAARVGIFVIGNRHYSSGVPGSGSKNKLALTAALA